MAKVQVSVIITTYNRSVLLPRAINSVLSQTFKDFELIVVDDGSTDNTREVVKEFEKRHENIQYIWQEHFGGAARPKNKGIKSAVGEYIAILDSDDEWLPEKLEKQINLFENSKNPKLGFVGCHSIVVGEKGIEYGIHRIPRYKDIFKNLFKRDYMGSGSGIMYRRSIFDELGLFDENLKSGQDWDMRVRIIQTYDFDFIDETLFKYYIYSGNIQNTFNPLIKAQDLSYLIKKYKQYHEKHPIIYSEWLRAVGTYYVLGKEIKKAREYFIKAIKIAPYHIRSYISLLVSFLGVNFYRNLLLINRKLIRNI